MNSEISLHICGGGEERGKERAGPEGVRTYRQADLRGSYGDVAVELRLGMRRG